jgi:hypothetical protein
MPPLERLVDLPGWLLVVALVPWWLRRVPGVVRERDAWRYERSSRRQR